MLSDLCGQLLSSATWITDSTEASQHINAYGSGQMRQLVLTILDRKADAQSSRLNCFINQSSNFLEQLFAANLTIEAKLRTNGFLMDSYIDFIRRLHLRVFKYKLIRISIIQYCVKN